jgi:phosphoribosylamine-glycine ligase
MFFGGLKMPIQQSLPYQTAHSLPLRNNVPAKISFAKYKNVWKEFYAFLQSLAWKAEQIIKRAGLEGGNGVTCQNTVGKYQQQ